VCAYLEDTGRRNVLFYVCVCVYVCKVRMCNVLRWQLTNTKKCEATNKSVIMSFLANYVTEFNDCVRKINKCVVEHKVFGITNV
jgi:hypothetical protein